MINVKYVAVIGILFLTLEHSAGDLFEKTCTVECDESSHYFDGDGLQCIGSGIPGGVWQLQSMPRHGGGVNLEQCFKANHLSDPGQYPFIPMGAPACPRQLNVRLHVIPAMVTLPDSKDFFWNEQITTLVYGKPLFIFAPSHYSGSSSEDLMELISDKMYPDDVNRIVIHSDHMTDSYHDIPTMMRHITENKLTPEELKYFVAMSSQPMIAALVVNSIFSSKLIGHDEKKMRSMAVATRCIGHGMGAHLCGFIGNAWKTFHGAKIHQITGLDPTGFNYQHNDQTVLPPCRLDPTDARGTFVIMSSIAKSSVATVDPKIQSWGYTAANIARTIVKVDCGDPDYCYTAEGQKDGYCRHNFAARLFAAVTNSAATCGTNAMPCDPARKTTDCLNANTICEKKNYLHVTDFACTDGSTCTEGVYHVEVQDKFPFCTK